MKVDILGGMQLMRLLCHFILLYLHFGSFKKVVLWLTHIIRFNSELVI
jgi:hypothetical protein